MKKSVLILGLAFSVMGSSALASHPHQAICMMKGQYPNGDQIQFLLQTESAREYVVGDPNLDTHDYRYQVRVCDDDNDSARCSTYENTALSHGPADKVTLAGMKDKSAIFFEGFFTEAGEMSGRIVQQVLKGDEYVKTLVPFKAKIEHCLNQSWVELKPESDSVAF